MPIMGARPLVCWQPGRADNCPSAVNPAQGKAHSHEHYMTPPSRSGVALGCQTARKRGSDAILVTMFSWSPNQPCLEQIDLTAPIHLTLDQFELGDLPLGLAV